MKQKEEDMTQAIKYENKLEEQIVEAIRAGKPLSGRDGILTPIIKKAVEAALSGEMENHLKQEKEEGKKNRRNGKISKTVKSAYGEFELDTPRDRDSKFVPEIIKKRQTCITDELDKKILSLFSLGMSYNDISENIKEIYGVNIESSQITTITDTLIPVINEWRSRPLESVYPIIFLDGLYTKVRIEGRVTTRVVYNIIGINMEGRKEVLGFYLAESEGANFWLNILTDLQNRGINDILIVCCDGLKGFPEAINSIFPQTEIQLCIVHQIRNSLKYVSYKHKKEFAKDLKLVYQANTSDNAKSQLTYISDKWEKRYPMVIKSWNDNWDNLSTFFKYNKMIRKIIYTTNIIEGFHRVVRKFTKTKGAFTSENALIKHIYSGIAAITKKWTMPLLEWQLTLSQLHIIFPDRINFAIINKK